MKRGIIDLGIVEIKLEFLWINILVALARPIDRENQLGIQIHSDTRGQEDPWGEVNPIVDITWRYIGDRWPGTRRIGEK